MKAIRWVWNGIKENKGWFIILLIILAIEWYLGIFGWYRDAIWPPAVVPPPG